MFARSPSWVLSPCISRLALAAAGCAATLSGACTPQPLAAPGPDDLSAKAESSEAAPPQSIPPSAAGNDAESPRDFVRDAVASASRSDEDRALDAQRKPEELLKFFQVAPGQRVAELAAGGGYTAELLARVVGSEGLVYGQNSPFILNRFAEKPWSERLAKPEMARVVRVDSEFESPLPQEATQLDAVFMVLFYHDTVWFKTDRDAMNRAIFAALRPGGIFAVVDHSARAGDGVTQARTLHRIEESVVREELESAGFVLDAEASFLRNPEDERDFNASPSAAGERRGTSDRFVLRFRKPAAASGIPNTAGKPETGSVTCENPRKPMCTREHRPVCATRDTGIRCVTTPCNSTELGTYSNGCTACADERVLSYTPGACPEGK